MKTKIISLSLCSLLMFPLVTHAENIEDLSGLIDFAKATLNSIVPLLFSITIVVFIWGVIKYIKADGPTKIAEARNYIIFSIVAIAVMLSVWGIALMLKNTFFKGSPTVLNLTPSSSLDSDFKYDPE